MTTTTGKAMVLALALLAPAARGEEATRPSQAERDAAPREAFWGEEPGRPYAETNHYTLPVLPIELSGYFWVDTGFMKQENTQAGSFNKSVDYAQGRFVLGAAYRRDLGDFFAEARVQLVGFDNEFTKSQYEPHTQDAFLRIGQRSWDVQVGRFLAWEPYWRGIGIDRYTAEEAGALGGPPMYRLDAAQGYRDEAGQIALHAYPAPWAALELSSVFGQEASQNHLGLRPVVALRRYGLLLMGGYEYVTQRPQDDSNKARLTTQGFAGRLQYTLAGVTLGLEAAHAAADAVQIDGLVDAEKTLDKSTVGGFLQVDVWGELLGAGYHFTRSKNEKGETDRHHQAFVALVHTLPVPGLSVWGVVGFARTRLEDADANSRWENDMTSYRLRLQYEFR